MKETVRIEPFDYEKVQLLEGRFKQQYWRIRDYYYAIPNDDMMKGFRKRAGMSAPGKELGGWYSRDIFHTFGQWLSAFPRMFKATNDVEVRDKAIYLMREWGKTISHDGFFFYSCDPNAPHYIYEKMVGGLVDVHKYIRTEEAIRYLERITDWAEENLDRRNLHAHNLGHGSTEWYTLSENLYRAYELTGEKRYRDFAKVWEYPSYWDCCANKEDIFEELRTSEKKYYHAYSHVNTLSGAAMAYKVTGEKHYLDTIVNAYKYLQDTQCFATGGYGPDERLIPPNGLAQTLEDGCNIRFHFETACGSWAAFKLARYLMTFTGEAHYGDWIERLMYNGIGALLPMDKHGRIMYGSQYHLPGGQKTLWNAWSCCTGTLPIAVADYHNLIYFKDGYSLYINLFIPSKVEWNSPEGPVTVIQETCFPEKGKVMIHIKPKSPSRFGLKFRVPLWTEGDVEVRVDGKPFKTTAIPGKWAVIERLWKPNDNVTLEFDLSPRIEPLTGFVSPIAVLCGPVVMVCTSDPRRIPINADLKNPSNWLTRPSESLEYSASKQGWNQKFRPYYRIEDLDPYKMYFDRPGGIVKSTDELTFYDDETGGSWATEGEIRYAEAPGSYFEAEFDGTAVVWEGLRGTDAGIAEVSIDGKKVAEVDQYGYTDLAGLTGWSKNVLHDLPFVWSLADLGEGKHTIDVTISSKTNPSSKGTKTTMRRLIIYR